MTTPTRKLLEDRDDGLVWLNNRLVGIVELNRAEDAQALDCALRRNQAYLGYHSREEVTGNRDSETLLAQHEQGAQGEIALAKWLGVKAPLADRVFMARPNVEPDWSVTTQGSEAMRKLGGALGLKRRHLDLGWRHALIEREFNIGTRSWVFVLHGWIAAKRVLEVGRQRYAWSDNLYVAPSYLEPMPPRLCQLDEKRILERAEGG